MTGLGPQSHQGGISPAPPPPPKGRLHRLPPILRRRDQEPMPGCSKAPRGLFVLPRVGRIFTASSISPGPSPRQRSGRYAFRAGRNLPDKEFRYLRTVIVTAAVHRGFGSGREPLPLTFRHRASVAPYTSSYEFAESCVFGKQSPEPIHCDSLGLLTLTEHPFSRSYGANLQSSLARVLPRALVLSHPPTCVGFRYGSPWVTLRGFSRLPGFRGLSPSRASPPRRAHERRICLPLTLRFWPGSSMAPVPLA